MMNEFQRRVLAEAAKFGGKFVSNSEKIANKLNEAPAIGAGSMSGLFGYSKQQFEMKMRQLIQKMGFEKGITRMDITDRGMTLHFANAAKARDFVITFNGLTKRQSKGSAASISTSFDKAKAPMGSNAIVTVDFSMLKMEGIENPSHLFMVLEALHEEYVGESATKAAIEDFMYDMLNKKAIAELKPIMKNQSVRGADLRNKVNAVLKKHKIPLMHLGGSSAQLVIDYFDTFHGESVEVNEAFIRQQQWATMRAKVTRGTPVNIVLKNGKTVSGELLRMDKYDRGTADQGYMLWVRTSGGNVKIEDVDVKSIQWNNDPKTKMSEEANLEEAKLPKGFKKGEMLWLPGGNKRGQLVRWEPASGVVGGMFTVELPGKKMQRVKAQDIFKANSTKLLTKKEEVEVAEQFKAGDKVKVPHKGKMVSGKIVRFDSGGTDKARQHGGGYVVDVGEPASILVPKQNVRKEEVEQIDEAYAPIDTPNIVGAFTETTKKKRFEYRKSTNKWGISHGLPHEVCVKEISPSEWRAANVKGTVCYIATDEGEGGKPVLEKWAIRNHVKYVKAEETDQEGEVISESIGDTKKLVVGMAKKVARMNPVVAKSKGEIPIGMTTKQAHEYLMNYGTPSEKAKAKKFLMGIRENIRENMGITYDTVEPTENELLTSARWLAGLMKNQKELSAMGMTKKEVQDNLEAVKTMLSVAKAHKATKTKKEQMEFGHRKILDATPTQREVNKAVQQQMRPSHPMSFKGKKPLKSFKKKIGDHIDDLKNNHFGKQGKKNHSLQKTESFNTKKAEGKESIQEQDRIPVQGSKMVYVGQTLRALQSKSMFSGSVVKGERYKVATNKSGKVDLVHQSMGYRTAVRNVDVTTIESLIKNKVLI